MMTLPMLVGSIPVQTGAANFLLTGGLLYALASVHLQRSLLWSVLAMLVAYPILMVFTLPYTWTATGAIIALALIGSGLSARPRAGAGARS